MGGRQTDRQADRQTDTYALSDGVLVCISGDLVGVEFGGDYGDEVLEHVVIWTEKGIH